MHKLKLLLPTLLLTAAIPAVSLTACAQPVEPEPEPEPEPLEGTEIEMHYDAFDYGANDIVLAKGEKYVAVMDLTDITYWQWLEAEGDGWAFFAQSGGLLGHVDKISIDDKVYLENDGYKTQTANKVDIASLSPTCLHKTYKTLKIQFVPEENKTADFRMEMRGGS